jgi:hypothetical protein
MSTIIEIIPRDWDHDKFTGELLNKARKKDTGGQYMFFLEEVEERSKKGNCAQVLLLGTSHVLPMTQTVKVDLTLRLSQLESLTDDRCYQIEARQNAQESQ